MMADLILWKQEQLRLLRAEMDRMITDFYRDFGAPIYNDVIGDLIQADITEDEESVIITTEMPRIATENLCPICSGELGNLVVLTVFAMEVATNS